MFKRQTLTAPLTALLLIALTTFSNCAGTKNYPRENPLAKELSTLAPDVPPAPKAETVTWTDSGNGLVLSYDDYRALERNIISLREYAAKLLVIINFYGGAK